MIEFDVEKFLSTPIEAFDFQFMIGDVKDFLEFSEINIDLQYKRELQVIVERKDLDEYPIEYEDHLQRSIDHRFQVSLPLRVRYGALLAFVTSVEWAVDYLNRVAIVPLVQAKGKTNFTVRLLKHFTASVSLTSETTIEDYEALVKIRNCVAHSSGVLETYRYKAELPKAVEKIHGFSIGNWHFFGEQICIERGAVEAQIERMLDLVVALHTAMREKGCLKPIVNTREGFGDTATIPA
jgi:hypothetical protein